MLDRRASIDPEQFEEAVVLQVDMRIEFPSGKVFAARDFEPKPFVIVLGLSVVTHCDTDVIDAPTLPENGLGGHLDIVRVRGGRRCGLSR